jgi:hypothetical protein
MTRSGRQSQTDTEKIAGTALNDAQVTDSKARGLQMRPERPDMSPPTSGAPQAENTPDRRFTRVMQAIRQRRIVSGGWRYWPAPAGGGAETLSRSFSSGCPCWPARLSASPLEASASLSSPRAAAGDRHALRLNSARQRRLCNERQLTSGGRHGESWTEWWTGRENGCNESHGGATSWYPCKAARPERWPGYVPPSARPGLPWVQPRQPWVPDQLRIRMSSAMD